MIGIGIGAAEVAGAVKAAGTIEKMGAAGKGLYEATSIAEKFMHLPETVQGIKETANMKDIAKKVIKEVAKEGAEQIYNHEAKEDPDLADIKSALDIAGDIKKKLSEKLEHLPETSREIILSLNGIDMQETVEGNGGIKGQETEKRDSDRLELTREEKIAKQDQAISEVEDGKRVLDSTQEKGNYGEMKTDQDLREKGYERISKDMVTDIDEPGHQGIDGVYYNPDGKPPYMIVDSKYRTAQLSDTLDGKQMSDNWIDKRLDESVGKEKADDIRAEKILNPENVGSYVSHVDDKGNISYDRLDGNANIIEKDVKM